MHDAVVIGAGPAGATTARTLAARGWDVVLLEEHDGIGRPVHCTGLLGYDAFTEFDLPRRLILGEAGTARFWGAAGQSVAVNSVRVQAAVIDRAGPDEHLADRAQRVGATIRLGARAESIAVHASGVDVAVRDQGVVHARAVVLACGANYRFHRSLGLGLPDVFLQSAQLEVPFPIEHEVQVRFGREVAPSGFAWLVPFTRGDASYARVGLMSESRSGERFDAFKQTLCREAGISGEAWPKARRKMLPLGPVARTYGDRVLAVGDAAGLVKPTTGGGIYYGLLSGALAGEVLAESLDRDRLGARTLRNFEARWRKRLGQEIRVGLAFRRIAARLSDDSIDSLIELAKVNGVVPLLQETATFNWHRKAAVALLGHPAVRRIVYKSWTRSAGQI